jgi:hypothetical protein
MLRSPRNRGQKPTLHSPYARAQLASALRTIAASRRYRPNGDRAWAIGQQSSRFLQIMLVNQGVDCVDREDAERIGLSLVKLPVSIAPFACSKESNRQCRLTSSSVAPPLHQSG